MPGRYLTYPPEYILATDLDGTLVGCEQSLQKLNLLIGKQRPKILLVYITGRMFSSAWQLVKAEGLLMPDIVISDVGTEIHVAPKFIRNAGWETKMGSTWKIGETRSLLSDVKNLIPQPVHPKFRLSYTTDGRNFNNVLSQLYEVKHQLRIPIEIVPSLGHIIDILPEGAGKGPALRFVQQMYDVATQRVFVCGDSGNDYSMFIHGFQGIVVGNACPDFKQQLKATSGCIHFAKAHYAAGILEGLQTYGLLDYPS
jgi:sucrose-6F-phosphate phosphohydrolase